MDRLNPRAIDSPNSGVDDAYKRRLASSPARAHQRSNSFLSPPRSSGSHSRSKASSSPWTADGKRLFASPQKRLKKRNGRSLSEMSDLQKVFHSFKRDPDRGTSPSYADRYIPSRLGSDLENGRVEVEKEQKADETTAFKTLLRAQLLNSPDASSHSPSRSSKPLAPRTLKFRTPEKRSLKSNMFAISPIGDTASHILSPPRTPRKIAKHPFKVLDAPALKDDFYLNLLDWSAQNVLAVALGSACYLWSACTSKVSQLCDLSGEDDSITAVSWTKRGTHLAIATRKGMVQIWDGVKGRKVRTMEGHGARIGTLDWNSQNILASGARDRTIYLRDPRTSSNFTSKLSGHKQEVCGLKWSPDDQQIASGGNDNKLLIWSASKSSPIAKFGQHCAAVKAIAWSPHQHGLLGSGGGTADRCIRFWNTLTAKPIASYDTGSQVCSMLWSKNVNEIVSTHGYSLNQIIVWKYPGMQKLATLSGHTYRVLYLSASPDGQTIVTGAGDETLRFWNVFPSSKTKGGSGFSSKLSFPGSPNIR